MASPSSTISKQHGLRNSGDITCFAVTPPCHGRVSFPDDLAWRVSCCGKDLAVVFDVIDAAREAAPQQCRLIIGEQADQACPATEAAHMACGVHGCHIRKRAAAAEDRPAPGPSVDRRCTHAPGAHPVSGTRMQNRYRFSGHSHRASKDLVSQTACALDSTSLEHASGPGM